MQAALGPQLQLQEASRGGNSGPGPPGYVQVQTGKHRPPSLLDLDLQGVAFTLQVLAYALCQRRLVSGQARAWLHAHACQRGAKQLWVMQIEPQSGCSEPEGDMRTGKSLTACRTYVPLWQCTWHLHD